MACLQVCEIGVLSWLPRQATEVFRAGGAGIIATLLPQVMQTRLNTPEESLLEVPYVVVGPADRERLLNYVWSTNNPTASFAEPEFSFQNTAPQMALFSSRGPTTTVKQLVLKPDITAPGALRPYIASRPACRLQRY